MSKAPENPEDYDPLLGDEHEGKEGRGFVPEFLRKAAVAGRKDEDRMYRAFRSPDDLLIVAAGGPAGGFGAVAPPWYGKKSLAVTMPVTMPGQ